MSVFSKIARRPAISTGDPADLGLSYPDPMIRRRDRVKVTIWPTRHELHTSRAWISIDEYELYISSPRQWTVIDTNQVESLTETENGHVILLRDGSKFYLTTSRPVKLVRMFRKVGMG